MKELKNLLIVIFIIVLCTITYLINIKLYSLLIKPVSLILYAIYLYKKTNGNHGRFVKNKEYIKKVLIYSLIYIIIYFLLGLIFGYLRSPYSHDITGIIQNTWQTITIIVTVEYIRSALINGNKNNIIFFLITSILLMFIEIGIIPIIRNLDTPEDIFKYSSSVLIPTFALQMVYSYLVLKGSYKLSLTYRLIIEMTMLLVPVFPDFDWFLTGIVSLINAFTIFIVFKYDYDKKKRDISRIKIKKEKPIFYIPVLCLVILLVGFVAGLFKYKPISILSNSMHPFFSRGDVVVFTKYDTKSLEKLEINDIIIYTLNNQNIVHRIIDKKIVGDTEIYQTMGDANNSPDLNWVEQSQIVGKYVFSIKYIGYPSIWLSEILKDEKAQVEIK